MSTAVPPPPLSTKPHAFRSPWWRSLPVLLAVAFLFGACVGVAGSGSGQEPAASPETVTETVTAAAEPGEAQTVTETVTGTPAPAETVTEVVTERVTERETVAAEPSPPPPPPGPSESFGDGTYVVGVDIQPGTYRTEAGDRCYWARLSGLGGNLEDIIANDLPTGPTLVEISASDAAFETQGCGTWQRAG